MFRGLGLSGFHRLHYTEWGPRDAARTVVCVHGYSGNSRDFDELARALSSEARVVCLDVAGRGRSDWLPSPLHYHFPQFLNDISGLLRHLHVDRVDWVGTSMGGLLGLLLASQPGHAVRRLVLNDVGAFVPAEGLREIARHLQAPERFDTLAAVERHLRETHREWGAITDAQYRALARHHAHRLTGGGYRLHYDPRITRLVQGVPFVDGLHLWDAWDRVECPALIVRGEHSRILPADVAQRMLDAHPDARLHEVAGAGHAPALMSADEIAVVGNFLVPRGAERSDAPARHPGARMARGRPQA
ncbi:MAG TPA: alpha/beta hydrolase [Usitatibacter sp.]|nr:alpha/beta hydrolase [Usitatibacter sp.]